MNINIHSVANGTCLVDLDRSEYERGRDPEGFTTLMSVRAARDLYLAENPRPVDPLHLNSRAQDNCPKCGEDLWRTHPVTHQPISVARLCRCERQ